MSHSNSIANSIPRLPRLNDINATQRYVDELVSALEDAIDVLSSTRQQSIAEINLTNTQEHGGNLRVGDVFSSSGILKIVRAQDIYVGPNTGTTGIGNVTVVTT
jgi:hypothetical protein